MIQVDSLTREEADLLFVETAESEEKYPIPSAFAAYTKYMNIRLGNEKYQQKSDSLPVADFRRNQG